MIWLRLLLTTLLTAVLVASLIAALITTLLTLFVCHRSLLYDARLSVFGVELPPSEGIALGQ